MTLWFALLTAFGCALSSGIATVLQKLSADKETKAVSLDVGLLFRLLRHWPYLAGVMLDLLAWGLTLIAVHNLPLFIVQPIIAFSVVVTALVESLIFHRQLNRRTVIAISFIMFGLIILGTTAAPEMVSNVSPVVRLIVIITPLLLAASIGLFAKATNNVSAIVLATVGGLAFGGDTIAGRMLSYAPPYWKILINPLFIAILAYGIVAILSLTIALQRQLASVVMAIVLAAETMIAIGVGLLFLGDSPRHGLWLPMIIGAGIALVGSVLVAVNNEIKPPVPPLDI